MSLKDVNLYASSIWGKRFEANYNSNAKATHPLNVGVLGQEFGVNHTEDDIRLQTLESTSIIGTTTRSSCNRQAKMTTLLLLRLLCILLLWTFTLPTFTLVTLSLSRGEKFTPPTLALKSRVKKPSYNSSRASQRTSCSTPATDLEFKKPSVLRSHRRHCFGVKPSVFGKPPSPLRWSQTEYTAHENFIS